MMERINLIVTLMSEPVGVEMSASVSETGIGIASIEIGTEKEIVIGPVIVSTILIGERVSDGRMTIWKRLSHSSKPIYYLWWFILLLPYLAKLTLLF
jgi:hypothetical protein